MSDPLEGLLVDQEEIDRERLAESIKGLVGVDQKGGKVVLMPGFEELKTAKLKVLAYLLGRRAANLLGKGMAGAGPTEISEELGIPRGTVGRIVRELTEDRTATQDDNNLYMVPSHQLSRAQRILEEGR